MPDSASYREEEEEACTSRGSLSSPTAVARSHRSRSWESVPGSVPVSRLGAGQTDGDALLSKSTEYEGLEGDLCSGRKPHGFQNVPCICIG